MLPCHWKIPKQTVAESTWFLFQKYFDPLHDGGERGFPQLSWWQFVNWSRMQWNILSIKECWITTQTCRKIKLPKCSCYMHTAHYYCYLWTQNKTYSGSSLKVRYSYSNYLAFTSLAHHSGKPNPSPLSIYLVWVCGHQSCITILIVKSHRNWYTD